MPRVGHQRSYTSRFTLCDAIQVPPWTMEPAQCSACRCDGQVPSSKVILLASTPLQTIEIDICRRWVLLARLRYDRVLVQQALLGRSSFILAGIIGEGLRAPFFFLVSVEERRHIGVDEPTLPGRASVDLAAQSRARAEHRFSSHHWAFLLPLN